MIYDEYGTNALDRKARYCKSEELPALLADFDGDAEAITIIRKAVVSAYKREDSGSYCENASPGYSNAAKKLEIMEEFSLSAARKQRRHSVDSEAGMSAVLQALEKINARLDKLEKPSRRRGPSGEHPFL